MKIQIIIFLLICFRMCAISCKCDESTLKVHYEQADLIFYGKITDISDTIFTEKKNSIKFIKTQFKVNEFMKGASDSVLNIYNHESYCDKPLRIGCTYLIYAYRTGYKNSKRKHFKNNILYQINYCSFIVRIFDLNSPIILLTRKYSDSTFREEHEKKELAYKKSTFEKNFQEFEVELEFAKNARSVTDSALLYEIHSKLANFLDSQKCSCIDFEKNVTSDGNRYYIKIINDQISQEKCNNYYNGKDEDSTNPANSRKSFQANPCNSYIYLDKTLPLPAF